MNSIQQTLLEHGFDPSEAEIYVILQQNGELDVPAVLQKTNMSRASVYDSLNFLYSKDLIEYRKDGRRAFYKPAHPNQLFGLLEQKKRESALLNKEMEQSISDLTGMYNLSQNKPGVRFFEGKEGFREALYDSLNAQETIRTFVDLDAVAKYVEDINVEYVKKRQKQEKSKKLLILDTPSSRAYLKRQGPDQTDARFLPKNMNPFRTGMQIYDNKISYFTLRKDNIMAVIIDDPDIYQMHKSIFDFLWNLQDKKTVAHTSDGQATVFNN